MTPIIHQITAPRTIQAFIVVLFSVVSCVLVLSGNQIPDLIGWSLAGIIGYYFNAEGKETFNGVSGGGTRLTPPLELPSLAQQMAGTQPVRKADEPVGSVSRERPLSPYAEHQSVLGKYSASRVGLLGAFNTVNTLSLPWFG